jgi:hypothetical protein
MLMETVILTLPSPETVVAGIPSAYFIRKRQEFIKSGKLIAHSTLVHPNGLTMVGAKIFRSKEDYEEWDSDPILRAREKLHLDHYRRNDIKVSRTTKIV